MNKVKEKLSSFWPLQRFLQALFIFWSLTFLIGSIEKEVFHLPEKNWYPLFSREASFTDFTHDRQRFKYFHHAYFFEFQGYPFTVPFSYPAPAAVAYESFYSFGRYDFAAYFSFCVIAFLGAGIVLGREMILRGLAFADSAVFIGSCFLLSYPFWFLIDRGNIEMVNWVLIAVGVTTYWHKRWYAAAALFGIAASFKIFPLMLLKLLVSARKYRAIL